MNIYIKSILIGLPLFLLPYPLMFFLFWLGKLFGTILISLLIALTLAFSIFLYKKNQYKDKVIADMRVVAITIGVLIFAFIFILGENFDNLNILFNITLSGRSLAWIIGYSIVTNALYGAYLATIGKNIFETHDFPIGMANIHKIAMEKGKNLKYGDMKYAFPKTSNEMTLLRFSISLLAYFAVIAMMCFIDFF